MKTTLTRALGGILLVTAGVGGPALLPAPAIAIPVFDATNYAQNLLQAARALEQINHQIASLQNEAAMLRTMERNLKTIDFPQLRKLTDAMKGIDRLMGEARGIGSEVERLDQRFGELFPQTAGPALRSDERLAAARSRLEAAMDSYRQSMRVQAGVVANVREDAEVLRELIERSQSAEGALQAQQATNQLLALSTKQQLQLQDLLASEFRSQAMERARRAQEADEARAATRRFLGTGMAGGRQP